MEPEQQCISVRRQCQLLGLSRSGLYYQPAGESPENLTFMRFLDEQYTRAPLYGVLRMTAWLNQQGYKVNAKRVRRLLRLMGLEAIYPKPNVSRAAAEPRSYPYVVTTNVFPLERGLSCGSDRRLLRRSETPAEESRRCRAGDTASMG